MKIKSVGVLLIVGLVVLSAIAVFVSPASACEFDFIKFNGTITDANGDPYVGHEIEIEKKAWGLWEWTSMGSNVTNSSGYYEIGRKCGYTFVCYENDTYRMYIDDNLVDEQYIDDWNYDFGCSCCFTWSFWSHQWDYQIPEFSSIVIPVVSILGLLFLFNRCKRRKAK